MSLNDEGPRFSVINSFDDGGRLWITAALSLTYFMLSGILRVFLSHKNFQIDSIILMIATVRAPPQVLTSQSNK